MIFSSTFVSSGLQKHRSCRLLDIVHDAFLQSLVEKELVKGINEEAHLLQLEIAALQMEASDRSRVRIKHHTIWVVGEYRTITYECDPADHIRTPAMWSPVFHVGPCGKRTCLENAEGASTWTSHVVATAQPSCRLVSCHHEPSRKPVQAFMQAEDQRDSAARQAVAAAARVQAAAGGGKAHVWAAAVCFASPVLHARRTKAHTSPS